MLRFAQWFAKLQGIAGSATPKIALFALLLLTI
jgi:hypothetical protein